MAVSTQVSKKEYMIVEIELNLSALRMLISVSDVVHTEVPRAQPLSSLVDPNAS